MKQTLFFTIASFLLAVASYGQWSGTSDELLTSGTATIQGTTAQLIFNDINLPAGGIVQRSGSIYSLSNALGFQERLYNFYDVNSNEMYWANPSGFNPTTGSTNVLTIDMGLADMTASTRGFVQFGPKDNIHLDFDHNEIQARDNLGTEHLFINNIGGDVVLGNAVNFGGLHYDRSEEKIGIGTNVPQDELHVMGSSRIEGDLPGLTLWDENSDHRATIQTAPGNQLPDGEFQIWSIDDIRIYSGNFFFS